MLERILENWLTSLNERGYEIPFTQLLSAEGFRVLHGPVHHPFEHGKDILALSQSGDLCAFQLKGGDIDLAELESIQGQLLALCATAVTYPGVEPPRRPDRVALVTNGKLTPPARGRIEAFNHGNRPLGLPVLECIEGEHLVGRFKDAHQQYLPSTPRDLNMFLNLYLADGNGPFPTDEFFVFVNSLIAPAIKSGPRRQIKRALASMVLFTAYTTSPWDRSKNLALCEFQCSAPVKMLSSTRDEDGQLHTWQPAAPESWARLYEKASSVDESDLPMELWQHAEMIPYLGLLLPFRFTSPIAKALDYFATRSCNINFVDEPEEDSEEANPGSD